MTLRDQIEEDNCDIFFDFDELAKEVHIDGHPVPVVEDGEQLDKYRQMGIMEGQLLVYVRTGSLPRIPEPGDAMRYGTRQLWVESAKEDMGILELVLKSRR